MWNLQLGTSQTSSAQHTFEDMSHRNTTVVSHSPVLLARLCVWARTPGPWTCEVFVQEFDGSSTPATVQRWTDIGLFLSLRRFRRASFCSVQQTVPSGDAGEYTVKQRRLELLVSALISMYCYLARPELGEAVGGDKTSEWKWCSAREPLLCGINRSLLHQIRDSFPGKHSFKEKKKKILGNKTNLLLGVDAGEIGHTRFAVFFNCHLHVVSMWLSNLLM